MDGTPGLLGNCPTSHLSGTAYNRNHADVRPHEDGSIPEPTRHVTLKSGSGELYHDTGAMRLQVLVLGILV